MEQAHEGWGPPTPLLLSPANLGGKGGGRAGPDSFQPGLWVAAAWRESGSSVQFPPSSP